MKEILPMLLIILKRMYFYWNFSTKERNLGCMESVLIRILFRGSSSLAHNVALHCHEVSMARYLHEYANE